VVYDYALAYETADWEKLEAMASDLRLDDSAVPGFTKRSPVAAAERRRRHRAA